MSNWRTKIMLLSYLIGNMNLQTKAQTVSDRLVFHTGNRIEVVVSKGSILVNKKALYKIEHDGVLYSSKRNKILENGGSVFLFLEMDGRPNVDRYYVFKITRHKVDSVTDAISSEIRDFDVDSFLEFGGSDLTEVHPSKDSMYYVPSAYYEIKNGRISYDSSLTKMIDTKVNGVFLLDQLDRDGLCCKVIPKPKKISVSQKPRNGVYTYAIAFGEWGGKSLGATCTVIIKGDSIKIIHNGTGDLTGQKGDILDEGIIMKHKKTGRWIIAHNLKDADIEEIGPCGTGPTTIDFKNKKWWSC